MPSHHQPTALPMRITIGLIALAVASTRALAQQAKDTTTLNPIVITATRVPVDQSVAPTAVTVIRGDDLRARGVAMVSDALASVPGLTLVRSGSFGATTSLFARGGESDYVKVLIDGVPVNNPGGAFDFASLTTDNLDRIEVVRGPASVTYGSDAVAGVVQLFTRHGTGPARGFADIRGGTFGTVEGEGGVAGGGSLVGYSVGASSRETDGFLPFNNDFRNQVASGRLTFTPAKSTIELAGRWNHATYHFPTDGSGAVVDSNSVREDHRTALGLDASRRLTSRVDLRLLGAASRLDGTSSNAPDSPGDSTGFYGNDDSRTERRSADLRTDVQAGSTATISLGANIEREQVRSRSESQFATFPASTTTFAEHRTNKALYGQVIGTASRLAYTVSGRVDETATFGTFTTGRASLALQAANNTTVRGAIGNAFKAPAFEETFSSAFTIGNADLEPERTTSWEVSAEQRIAGRAVLTATYFDQHFRDLIQYVLGDESTEFRGTNQNLGAATARGLELEVRAPAIGRFDLGANATFLRTRVTDAGNGAFGTFVDGERLLRRPDQTAAFSADYRVTSSSRVGAAVRFVGKRDDRDFAADARVTLPSYTLLDLSGEWALASLSPSLTPVRLTARIENVLDKEYEPAFGFTAPGRTVLVGAKVALGGR